MRTIGLLLLGLTAAALPSWPATAQTAAGGGDFRTGCRPPLKFMAGACVPQCYPGYEDRGTWCEYIRSSGGGGR